MANDSGKWKLQAKDFFKGFIVAALTAIVAVVSSTIEAGSLKFDWPLMGKTALLAGLAYILKNWATSNTGDFLGKDKPSV